MRTFVAVNLDRQIQNELAAMQHELAKTVRGFRWINRELLHITLKFLGETDPRTVPAIIDALRKPGGKTRPFTLSFSGIGVFPSIRRPRVIWIGMEEGVSELAGLAQAAGEALRAIGVISGKGIDSQFTPHLTLGRARKNETAYLPPDVLARKQYLATPLQVGSFYLMESKLFPGGPVYKAVQKFLLK